MSGNYFNYFFSVGTVFLWIGPDLQLTIWNIGVKIPVVETRDGEQNTTSSAFWNILDYLWHPYIAGRHALMKDLQETDAFLLQELKVRRNLLSTKATLNTWNWTTESHPAFFLNLDTGMGYRLQEMINIFELGWKFVNYLVNLLKFSFFEIYLLSLLLLFLFIYLRPNKINARETY